MSLHCQVHIELGPQTRTLFHVCNTIYRSKVRCQFIGCVVHAFFNLLGGSVCLQGALV